MQVSIAVFLAFKNGFPDGKDSSDLIKCFLMSKLCCMSKVLL